MNAIYEFITIFVQLFTDMAFYLLFGLLFVALLNIYFTKDLIVKYIGKDNLWSVIKASLLGVPLPLCSCGVVPTVVYMSKNGASRGAVISFLVSTPQTGIDSIVATYGMMGPFMAIYRPFAALFTGIISGAAVYKIPANNDFKLQDYKPECTDSCCADDDCCETDNCNDHCSVNHHHGNKYYKGLRYAFVEFLDDITPQFLAGLFIAALITYFVPQDYFADSRYNSGILGMLIMMAIGIPMYICATASIPIAVSLILKGFSPGAAFVFLVTGPATNAATLAILFKTLGKKTVVLYLSLLAVLSIGFGYLLDYLIRILNVDMNLQICMYDNCRSSSASAFEIISALIFLSLILMSIYRIYFKKHTTQKAIMNNKKYLKITGMNCSHCSGSVEKILESIPGLTHINVNHQTGIAEYEGDADISIIIDKIKEAGYTAQEFKE